MTYVHVYLQVLMPLYDGLARHWLLMVVDLKHRHVVVYNSLPLT